MEEVETSKGFLPDKVDIVGMDYEVRLKDKVSKDSSVLGYHRAGESIIEIARMVGETERTIPSIQHTFMHEVIHATAHTICIGSDMDERNIDSFAYSLYQLLVLNNIFSYEEIPECIVSSGFAYDIVYPFEDMMDDQIYFLNYQAQEIYLRERTINTESLSDDYKRQSLFSAGIDMTAKLYVIDELRNSNVCGPIAAALYQVVKANDLERLLKKYADERVMRRVF